MKYVTRIADKIKSWFDKSENAQSAPLELVEDRLAASVRRNAEVIAGLLREKAQREAAYKAWRENVRQVDELLKRQAA